MALVTRLMSGCYIDGIVEVFAVYNDVTNELQDIIVKGDSGREVDVTVAGELVEIGKHNLQELKFNHAKRKLRFVISPPGVDDNLDQTPSIICTYYAEKLSRADIITDKLIELSK